MVKKQLSDEQIDALMRTLVGKSAADEALLDEIADSPATWWGVQRQINEQKTTELFAWPPVGKMLRWLMAGGVVTAAAVLVLAFFVFRPTSNDHRASVANGPLSNSLIQTAPETVRPNESVSDESKNGNASVISDAKPVKAAVRQPKIQMVDKSRSFVRKNNPSTIDLAPKATKKEEIKTEFIALSYARDPESGQIVRVKVPSTMMVSLGLVTSIKTPNEMVDAEVLVGDDGLTRAIRFIR